MRGSVWRIMTAALVCALSAPVAAQWINHKTPGIPRLPDGKPNLKAPAPKAANGKPDLSGMWQMDSLGYGFNILGDRASEMLPWAQALYKQRADNYGRDDPSGKCLPPGPRVGLAGFDPLKIVQTPNLVVVLYEEGPTRQIFTDGRDLPKDPNPTWMGYSVGRWEGNTLVVQSTGFNDKTWLDFSGHPHSDALTLTERFTRRDFGHMQVELTFDDPKTYTRPWTISVAVNYIADDDLIEYVCSENERDDRHLVGTLQDEKKQEVKVSRDTLSRYPGTYRIEPFGEFRISVANDQLQMALPGGGVSQSLVAQSDRQFVSPIGVIVEFIVGPQGPATEMVLKLVEGDMKEARVGGAGGR